MLDRQSIKKIIKATGINRRWLSKQVGIEYYILIDMLRDKSPCSKDQAKSIAKALGVALGDVWEADK